MVKAALMNDLHWVRDQIKKGCDVVAKRTEDGGIVVNRWVAFLVSFVAVVGSTVSVHSKIMYDVQQSAIVRLEEKAERNATRIQNLEILMASTATKLDAIGAGIEELHEELRRKQER